MYIKLVNEKKCKKETQNKTKKQNSYDFFFFKSLKDINNISPRDKFIVTY